MSKTHGMSKAREYFVWAAMIRRCTRERATDYARYGGRGISVCERWRKFENFIADMGLRPTPKHQLDRIDVDGNYEPSNCRWADLVQQANNKRNSRIVTYCGQHMTVAEAVALAGEVVTRENAICRLNNGWSVEQAVETPPLFKRHPKTRKIVSGFHRSRKSFENSDWWS